MRFFPKFLLLTLFYIFQGSSCQPRVLSYLFIVCEINYHIFPGFLTGNFLFELTSCYPVQVIFIVFARIKLQLQILTRYLVSASGVRFGECLSVVWSLPTSPAGSSRQPVWWWLVVGWQHRARLASAWIFKYESQLLASRPVIICMQQTANGGTGAGQTPRGVMEVRISD